MQQHGACTREAVCDADTVFPIKAGAVFDAPIVLIGICGNSLASMKEKVGVTCSSFAAGSFLGIALWLGLAVPFFAHRLVLYAPLKGGELGDEARPVMVSVAGSCSWCCLAQAASVAPSHFVLR